MKENHTENEGGRNTLTNDDRAQQSQPIEGAILLPELTEQDIEEATQGNASSWAKSTRGLGLGLVWNDPGLGLALQAISADSLRLLTVVDHPYCLRMAAMVAISLEHVGMRLVVDEHTILAEYDDNVVPVTGDPRRGSDPSDDVGVV